MRRQRSQETGRRRAVQASVARRGFSSGPLPRPDAEAAHLPAVPSDASQHRSGYPPFSVHTTRSTVRALGPTQSHSYRAAVKGSGAHARENVRSENPRDASASRNGTPMLSPPANLPETKRS